MINSSMKPKNFVLVALLVALAAVCIWWLMKSPSASEDKAAQLPSPIKADAIAPVMRTAQVELPKLPPVAAKSDSSLGSDTLSDTDPRAELNTAIAGAISLIENNDMADYLKETIPPTMLAKMLRGRSVEPLAQEMEKSKYRDAWLKNLTALKTTQSQNPILTDGGNTATFETHLDDPVRTEVVFKKVNGIWYVDHL